MSSLDHFAHDQLAVLDQRQQRRRLSPTVQQGVEVLRDGQRYVAFAGNDYLGLSRHPQVVEAGKVALEQYGAGAVASRLITGDHPLYAPLERMLATHKMTEAARVFGSGYLTNLGVIPALVGKGDLVVVDKLAHACILDGAQLSGAVLKRFRHNDVAHVAQILHEERGKHTRALIVTDHIFSMDGDRAPLKELSSVAAAHDAWLMADDAHGIGFFDDYAELGVDLWMGTLSKALGSYGGYVAGSRAVIDYLTTSARSFMFTTGLPPSVCATAAMALEIMQREPQRATSARAHARHVAAALGLPEPAAAIVPILMGSEEAALQASEALKAQGMLSVAVRPPTVPPGTSRLRLAFSAEHTDAQIDTLIEALKQVMA